MFHFSHGLRVLGMELEQARLKSGIRSEMDDGDAYAWSARDAIALKAMTIVFGARPGGSGPESCPTAKTSN